MHSRLRPMLFRWNFRRLAAEKSILFVGDCRCGTTGIGVIGGT